MKYFKYFLLIMLCSFALYALPVNNGLIAYYNFDSGITNLASTSINTDAQNGVVSNSNTGINGSGGLVMDGVNDQVHVTNVPLNTSSGGSNTVNFWMKWGGFNKAAGDMPVGFLNFDLWIRNNYFGFNSDGGDVTGIDAGTNASDLAGEWLFVSAVFYNGAPSPSTHHLYINGVKQTISLKMGTPYSRTAPNYFYIGSYNSGGSYNFKGTIDEFSVFDRALSGSEISQLYDASNVPEPSSFLLLVLTGISTLFVIKKKSD